MTSKHRANLDRLRAVMQVRQLSAPQVAAIVERSEGTIHMYRSGLRNVPDAVVEKLEAWFRADAPTLGDA